MVVEAATTHAHGRLCDPFGLRPLTICLMGLSRGSPGGRMLEEIEPTTRQVLGGAHPLTVDIEKCLQASREALAARR